MTTTANSTISVLIAAYRAGHWLTPCLESVLAQQLPAGWQLQVLLGIDGCEATKLAASKMQDNVQNNMQHNALSRFFYPQNAGTYITFNSLLARASGELICRFDADDVMKPGYLAQQIQLLGAHADVTATWSIYTDEQLQPTSFVPAHKVRYPSSGENPKAVDGQFMVKKHVFEQLGGFQPWRIGADTDLHNRMRCAGFKHGVVEDFLYFRRTHLTSLIAHPSTNFDSPKRKAVQQLTAEYAQCYQTGERPLYVQPECHPSYVEF